MSSTSRGRASKKKVVEEVEEEVKKVEKAAAKAVKKAEKAVERKVEKRKVAPRPTGRIPMAVVTARHGTGTITREGRGFSLGELSGGGLSPGLAARWGVRVDLRRRSTLEGNVSALSSWHATGLKAAAGRDAKAVEEEVKEVAKEIEEEVVIAAEEVERAAKEVEKGAKKAEKAVKKKVEKKARPKKKP